MSRESSLQLCISNHPSVLLLLLFYLYAADAMMEENALVSQVVEDADFKRRRKKYIEEIRKWITK